MNMEKIDRTKQISEMNVGKRFLNVCNSNDVYTVGELIDTPIEKIREFKNVGRQTLEEIEVFVNWYTILERAEECLNPYVTIGEETFVKCILYGKYLKEVLVSIKSIKSIELKDRGLDCGVKINVEGDKDEYRTACSSEVFLNQTAKRHEALVQSKKQ